MIKNYKGINSERGFTIVELMISTVIFSMILLLLTTGVISFTKSYYKGITETNTQRVARLISDDVSQTIQLSSSKLVQLDDFNGYSGFCVGNQAYAYKPYWQLVSSLSSSSASKHQALHGLIKGNVSAGCTIYNGASLYDYLLKLSDTEEMLSPLMRLSKLSVTYQSNGLYSIAVNVAYGDDDLLNSALSSAPSCKSQAGSQFCAVSSLSTVVQKRIQQ